MALLELKDLTKGFRAPDGGWHSVIEVPAFELEAGAQVALCGESGSGKTTLLHLIAGILRPDAGGVVLDGEDLVRLPESQRDRVRARKVGYVFQTFNLLQGYTCRENLEVAMHFGAGVDRRRAEALLARVGLSGHRDHRPRQLSMGQQQRVAVARALANTPRLVLADEPTGNLDAVNSREVLALIRETCREVGAALLLVSHDREVLGEFETVVDWGRLNVKRAPIPGKEAP